MANQADIGDAVASFYGADAGDQLTALLQTHINQAVPVLQAAKAGDPDALDEALDDWYANARDIADFLSAANPRNWDRHAMREMMETHITQTTAYAGAVLGGDYQGAIAIYDEARAHMSDMADTLSAGVVPPTQRLLAVAGDRCDGSVVTVGGIEQLCGDVPPEHGERHGLLPRAASQR